MSKRLVRARSKIRHGRISFALPDRTRLEERLAEVHAVLYLVFTEGYLASGRGPAVRLELCDEAVWLGRQLHRLVPDEAETTGLLALMLLHGARGRARQDSGGRLVPFDEQDRSLWDLRLVDEAKGLLARTGSERPGPYQLQAAIALLHAVAPNGDAVRWQSVARLYEALYRAAPSPAVAVNRAVAVGRAHGPVAGLAALVPVLNDDTMAGYLPLHAAHADLLGRAGRAQESAAAWKAAADLAVDEEHAAEFMRRAHTAGRQHPGLLP
jgi:RNA polymerase sigma-70 factor (ECF subfamily)